MLHYNLLAPGNVHIIYIYISPYLASTCFGWSPFSGSWQPSSGVKLVKWCEVWCGANWRDLCEMSLFWREVKWSEECYGEVLRDKIRVTLNSGYFTELWIFYLVRVLYCGCINLFCNVCVCVCVCGCVCVCVCGFCNVCVGVGFVLGGCVYVWVL